MRNQLILSRRLAAVAAVGVVSCALGVATLHAADDASKADSAVGASASTSGGQQTVLFNGKDLTGWKTRDPAKKDLWKVAADAAVDPANPRALKASGQPSGEQAALVLEKSGPGGDLISEQEFGDGEFHVEFMVPRGSNSGFYLMGRYEIQVMDSFGKPKESLRPGDVGGIYATKAPGENAAKEPGQWQSFDVVFRAPRFDASGKKTEDALFVSVKLNGQTIHENVRAPKPTGSEIDSKEAPKGPIMLQGDHGPVAYRNITVKPLAMREGK